MLACTPHGSRSKGQDKLWGWLCCDHNKSLVSRPAIWWLPPTLNAGAAACSDCAGPREDDTQPIACLKTGQAEAGTHSKARGLQWARHSVCSMKLQHTPGSAPLAAPAQQRWARQQRDAAPWRALAAHMPSTVLPCGTKGNGMQGKQRQSPLKAAK